MHIVRALVFAVLVVSAGAVLGAQGNNSQTQPSVTLPTVTVVAQKEPVDLQKLPVSVTAVTTDWLRLGDIRFISDAAIYSPNTFYSDFTARKLVNPRFRGLGSSPAASPPRRAPRTGAPRSSPPRCARAPTACSRRRRPSARART